MSSPLDRFADETVGIYGFGNTGRTLASELSGVVDELIVYEDDPTADPDEYETAENARWVLSPTVLQEELDFLLVSPGIPGDHPILRQAREFGVPVWGDLELAYRLMQDGTVWAITGTNGKSTCAELLGRLLEERYGESAVSVCGNRGSPFIHELLNTPSEHYVVEVSSFQVENMEDFRPDAAILTNLGDDHMNYHETREEYHGLKLELLKRVPEGGRVVVPASEADRSWLQKRDTRALDTDAMRTGTLSWDPEEGLTMGDERIAAGTVPASLRQFPENLLSTLALVREDLTVEDVRGAFEAFDPLPYRAQPIPTDNGRTIINDSKGTNPSAVLEQLNRRDDPVHLVLGGEAKETNYEALVNAITDRDVRSVTLAGEGSTTERLAELCDRQSINYRRIDDWESAVKETAKTLEAGETLLLSPGGTSFDAFENYRDRGEQFDRWVREVV